MNKQKYTDNELIDLFNMGNTSAETAFNYLVQEYSQVLYWSIRRITKDHETTNDILQNAWIKTWKNIDLFEGKSSLFTWIYRICKNETLNLLKKEQRHRSEQLDEPMVQLIPSSNLYNKYSPEEISQILQLAIDELPEKQAIVFNLKYFDEMKYSEMSTLLNTSEGGLKASYSIAVQKIRVFIEKI